MIYKPVIFYFIVFVASIVSDCSWSDEYPTNPNVTDATIQQTICIRGWTKSIRPPVSYTNAIKRRKMAEIGVPSEGEAEIKLDHIIPLALGGSPDSIGNLTLQPDDEAKDKDRVEVCLARMVCSGKVSLVDAQKAIWENWRTAGKLCSGYDLLNLRNE